MSSNLKTAFIANTVERYDVVGQIREKIKQDERGFGALRAMSDDALRGLVTADDAGQLYVAYINNIFDSTRSGLAALKRGLSEFAVQTHSEASEGSIINPSEIPLFLQTEQTGVKTGLFFIYTLHR